MSRGIELSKIYNAFVQSPKYSSLTDEQREEYRQRYNKALVRAADLDIAESQAQPSAKPPADTEPAQPYQSAASPEALDQSQPQSRIIAKKFDNLRRSTVWSDKLSEEQRQLATENAKTLHRQALAEEGVNPDLNARQVEQQEIMKHYMPPETDKKMSDGSLGTVGSALNKSLKRVPVSLASTVAGGGGMILDAVGKAAGALWPAAGDAISGAGTGLVNASNIADAWNQYAFPPEQAMPETIKDFKNMSPGQVVTMLADQSPEQAASFILPMFGGARALKIASNALQGANAAGKLGKVLKPVSWLLKGKTPQAAQRMGAFGASALQSYADIGKEQLQETGEITQKTAIPAALAMGKLESLVPASAEWVAGLKSGTRKAFTEAMKSPVKFLAHVGAEATKNSTIEGVTEFVQEGIQKIALELSKQYPGEDFSKAVAEAKEAMSRRGYAGLIEAAEGSETVGRLAMATLLGGVTGFAFEGTGRTLGGAEYMASPVRRYDAMVSAKTDEEKKVAAEAWGKLKPEQRAEAAREASFRSMFELDDPESDDATVKEALDIIRDLKPEGYAALSRSLAANGWVPSEKHQERVEQFLAENPEFAEKLAKIPGVQNAPKVTQEKPYVNLEPKSNISNQEAAAKPQPIPGLENLINQVADQSSGDKQQQAQAVLKLLRKISDNPLAPEIPAIQQHLAQVDPEVMNLAQERYKTELRSGRPTEIMNPRGQRPISPAGYEELGNIPGLKGKQTEITNPKGAEVEGEFRIVEADEGRNSFAEGYDQRLQDRIIHGSDDAVTASRQNIERILGGLKPGKLITDYMSADAGPSVFGVGADGQLEVEIGNHRDQAIREGYANGDFEAYRTYLIENAEKFGYSKADVEAFKSPKLIRVRTTKLSPEERIKFANGGNLWEGGAKDATSVAQTDAKAIGPVLDTLIVPEDGNINIPSNREFFQKFLDKTAAPQEHAALLHKDALSQAGMSKVKNAIFAYAYENQGLIDRFAASDEEDIKKVLGGMLIASGDSAKLKSQIQSGSLFDVQIGSTLAKAADKLAELRAQKTPVEQYLKQGQFFRDGMTPEAKILLVVADEAKSAKSVSEIITAFNDAVRKAGHPAQLTMDGPTQAPSKAELLRSVIEKHLPDALEKADRIIANAPSLEELENTTFSRKGQPQPAADGNQKLFDLLERIGQNADPETAQASNKLVDLINSLGSDMTDQSTTKFSVSGKEESAMRKAATAISQKYGIKLDLIESKDNVSISRIVVPAEKRSMGIGSRAMNELIAAANENAKTLSLTPSKDFGATSIERLKSFYKDLGFVENKGKNKDFSISDSMYKTPGQATDDKTVGDTNQGQVKYFSQPKEPGAQAGVISREELENTARTIQANLEPTTGVKVVVLETTDELTEIIQEANPAADPVPSDVEGALFNNTAYLVRNNLPDAKRAVEVAGHEIIGHFGLQAILGREFTSQLVELEKLAETDQQVKAELDRAEKDYFDEDESAAKNRRIALEEALARISEKYAADPDTFGGKVRAWFEQSIGKIRDALRVLGFDIKFTASDLANTIRSSKAAVTRDGSFNKKPRLSTMAEVAAVDEKYRRAGPEAEQAWKYAKKNAHKILFSYGRAEDFPFFKHLSPETQAAVRSDLEAHARGNKARIEEARKNARTETSIRSLLEFEHNPVQWAPFMLNGKNASIDALDAAKSIAQKDSRLKAFRAQVDIKNQKFLNDFMKGNEDLADEVFLKKFAVFFKEAIDSISPNNVLVKKGGDDWDAIVITSRDVTEEDFQFHLEAAHRKVLKYALEQKIAKDVANARAEEPDLLGESLAMNYEFAPNDPRLISLSKKYASKLWKYLTARGIGLRIGVVDATNLSFDQTNDMLAEQHHREKTGESLNAKAAKELRRIFKKSVSLVQRALAPIRDRVEGKILASADGGTEEQTVERSRAKSQWGISPVDLEHEEVLPNRLEEQPQPSKLERLISQIGEELPPQHKETGNKLLDILSSLGDDTASDDPQFSIKTGSLGKPGFQPMHPVMAGDESFVRARGIERPGHVYDDSNFGSGPSINNRYGNWSNRFPNPETAAWVRREELKENARFREEQRQGYEKIRAAAEYQIGKDLTGDPRFSRKGGRVEDRQSAQQLTLDFFSAEPKSRLEEVLESFPGEARYSYAGQNAKRPKNVRTWEEAKARLDAGEDPEAVRLGTGWFVSPYDKKPRFEIDDSQAKWIKKPKQFKDGKANYGELGEILKHDTLFEAYPQLKAALVKIEINPDFEINGSAQGPTANTPAWITIEAPDADSAKDVLVHEYQHLIQRIEGFARGGNSEMFERESEDEARKRGARSYADIARKIFEEESPEFQAAARKVNREVNLNAGADKQSEAYYAARKDFSEKFGKKAEEYLMNSDFADQVWRGEANFDARGRYISPMSPFDKYRSLAGEIEARDAADRTELSTKERELYPPYSTAEYGPDEAIVRYSISDSAAKKAFDSTKKKFGVTDSLQEAGYVLPDGSLLDFSGRNQTGDYKLVGGKYVLRQPGRDWMKGQRSVDHREIKWDEHPDGGADAMVEFMRKGAIRIDAAAGMISLHGRNSLTPAQKAVLRRIVEESDGGWLDLEDDNGQRASIEYDSGDWKKVLRTLNAWEGGQTPKSGPLFSKKSGTEFLKDMKFEAQHERAARLQPAADIPSLHSFILKKGLSPRQVSKDKTLINELRAEYNDLYGEQRNNPPATVTDALTGRQIQNFPLPPAHPWDDPNADSMSDEESQKAMDDYFEELERHYRSLEKWADNTPDVLRFAQESGELIYVVSRDTYGKSPWRVTTFYKDKDTGEIRPSGHMSYGSKIEAVKEASAHGNNVFRPDIVFSRKSSNQTETQEFKKWFGNSKIVDDQGRPMVVYHGTNKKFNVFAVEKDGLPNDAAMFFSGSKKVAEDFAGMRSDTTKGKPRVVEAYLNINNPAQIGNIDDLVTIDQLWKRAGLDVRTIPEGLADLQGGAKMPVWQWYAEEPAVWRAIEDAGFDGAVGTERGEPLYVAFSPTQAKSATDNRGTFDPENPDIRFSKQGEADPGFRTYSEMERTLTKPGMLPKKASKADMVSAIQKHVGKFKKVELEESGLIEHLQSMQDDQVTSQDVADYLDMNRIELEEKDSARWIINTADDTAQRYFDTEKEAKAAIEAERKWVESDAVTVDIGDNLITVVDQIDGTIFAAQGDEKGLWFDRYGVLHHASKDEAIAMAESKAEKQRDYYRNLISAEPEFDGGRTQYKKYQVRGGKKYRELLLTLPSAGTRRTGGSADVAGFGVVEFADNEIPMFQSLHWGEPNVLLHVRFNEREDADGNKVLFVEEIQSDWHQAGRKKGYRKPGMQKRIEELEAEIQEIQAKGREATQEDKQRWADLKNEHQNLVRTMTKGAPEAPMKQTDRWAMLGMKRMIQWAADNGFDKVAWAPGDEQAKRYDLSKQISEIIFEDNQSGGIGLARLDGPATNGQLIAFDNNKRLVINQHIQPEQLEDYIGKDAAKKLLEQQPQRTQSAGIGVRQRKLSGVNLKVGGEGMKSFYDNILKNETAKYIKKWGAKVGEVEIFPAGENDFYRGENLKAHGFDITPAMRQGVAAGQPLYSKKGGDLADQLDPNPEPAPTLTEESKSQAAKVFGAIRQVASGLMGKTVSQRDRENPAFKRSQTLNPEADTDFELERKNKIDAATKARAFEDKTILDHLDADKNLITGMIRKLTPKGDLQDWLLKKAARVLAPYQAAKPIERILFTVGENIAWDGSKIVASPGIRSYNPETGEYEYKPSEHAAAAMHFFNMLSPEWQELMTERAKANEEYRQNFVNVVIPHRKAQTAIALLARYRQMGADRTALEGAEAEARSMLKALDGKIDQAEHNELKSLLEEVVSIPADRINKMVVRMESIIKQATGELKTPAQLQRALKSLNTNRGHYGYVHHFFESDRVPSQGKAFDAFGRVPNGWIEDVPGTQKIRTDAEGNKRNLLEADIAKEAKEAKAEAANNWMRDIEDQRGLLVEEFEDIPDDQMPEGYVGYENERPFRRRVFANFGKYRGQEIYLPVKTFDSYKLVKEKGVDDPSMKEFGETIAMLDGVANRMNEAMLYHTGKFARDLLSAPFHIIEFVRDWSFTSPTEIPFVIKALTKAIASQASAKTWQKSTPESHGEYSESLPYQNKSDKKSFLTRAGDAIGRLITKDLPVGSTVAAMLKEINLSGAADLPLKRIFESVGEQLAERRGLKGKARERFVYDMINQYAFVTQDLPPWLAWLRGQMPSKESRGAGAIMRLTIPFLGYSSRLAKQMLADPVSKGLLPMAKRLIGKKDADANFLREFSEASRPFFWLFFKSLVASGLGGLLPPEEEGIASDIQDAENLNPLARTHGRILWSQDDDPKGGENWLSVKGLGHLQVADALSDVVAGKSSVSDLSTEFLTIHPAMSWILGSVGVENPYDAKVPKGARAGRMLAQALVPQLTRYGPEMGKFFRAAAGNNTIPDAQKQSFFTAFFEQLGIPAGEVKVDRDGKLRTTRTALELLKQVGVNMRHIPYDMIAEAVDSELGSAKYYTDRLEMIQEYRDGDRDTDLSEREFIAQTLQTNKWTKIDDAERDMTKALVDRGQGALATLAKLRQKGVPVNAKPPKKKKDKGFGGSFGGKKFGGGFGSSFKKSPESKREEKISDLEKTIQEIQSKQPKSKSWYDQLLDVVKSI